MAESGMIDAFRLVHGETKAGFSRLAQEKKPFLAFLATGQPGAAELRVGLSNRRLYMN